MDKRSLLAIVLSAAVIIGYYALFFKPPPPPSNAPEVKSPASVETQKTPETQALPIPSVTQEIPLQELPPEKISEFENALYRLKESNFGGVVRSFQIKGYRETADPKSPFVDLFALSPSKNFTLQFHQANFTLPSPLAYEVKASGDNFVEYQWKGEGLFLTERVEWDPKNYVAQVKVALENKGTQALETSLGLRLETAQHPHQASRWSFLKGPENLKYPILYLDKGAKRHTDVQKLPAVTQEKGLFLWSGLEDRYFLWAIISRALSDQTEVQYGWREGGILFSELAYPKEIIAPSAKMEKEFSVYIGPKEIERLKALGVHLEGAVDYGWFSIVAQPILFFLKLFHKGVGNWGIAIILLTVFVKIILHPINKKTLESMKAMQKLQPQLALIREKYKNDRERLNVEMMNLFRTHKVNPMGGCLPMLLQMPVYIALYKVLYNAIELYHAPFFGFYKDLSAPDPYFISPVLLGIFMVLQQKMSPSPSQDPAQAKAMMLMPIMFSVFMLFLPAGLVLYIFVNTFMTVVQQYMHQHEMSLTDLIRRGRKAP